MQGNFGRFEWRPFGFRKSRRGRGLRSERRSSPCIFQVVASLSIWILKLSYYYHYLHTDTDFPLQMTMYNISKSYSRYMKRLLENRQAKDLLTSGRRVGLAARLVFGQFHPVVPRDFVKLTVVLSVWLFLVCRLISWWYITINLSLGNVLLSLRYLQCFVT
jgi:hypothetical protein